MRAMTVGRLCREYSVCISLSCIVGDDGKWPYFENDWVKVLDWKNDQLKSQGRQQISRYHAADCSSRVGEFKGWTAAEQREFSTKLFDGIWGPLGQ